MKENMRLYDLQCKDVINLTDGKRLGRVSDVEFDGVTGSIISLVVPGRPRFFGLFGKREEFVIPWEEINRIGLDSVLVESRVEELPGPPICGGIIERYRG